MQVRGRGLNREALKRGSIRESRVDRDSSLMISTAPDSIKACLKFQSLLTSIGVKERAQWLNELTGCLDES